MEDKKNHKGSVDSASVANDESNDSEVSADVLSVSSGIDSLIDSWISDSAYSYNVSK
jgi:hypothetical protein